MKTLPVRSSKKPLIVALLAAVAILGGAVAMRGRTPQASPQAPAEGTAQTPSPVAQELRVGLPFPDFSLTDVDGRTLTRASLKDKPSIVWFTTSWCVPCQIGARKVAQTDNDLGGNAFAVLVVFVDPRETPDKLRAWRKNFANEDWYVAFDDSLTQLAARVNLKFLDSKFLLDRNGVIKNIDFEIADEDYLDTIERIVKSGS